MFSKEAERKMLEAIAKGELDNYKGKGEPFPEEFWDEGNPLVPDDLKQAYKIYKNASILPEEVTLKKELEELRAKLKDENLSADERKTLIEKMNQKEVEFNIKLESFRSMSGRK